MQTSHAALLNACKAVDADIELMGKVSAASVEMVRTAIAAVPRFSNVYCSQCGREFGPGNSGFSHCRDHNAPEAA